MNGSHEKTSGTQNKSSFLRNEETPILWAINQILKKYAEQKKLTLLFEIDAFPLAKNTPSARDCYKAFQALIQQAIIERSTPVYDPLIPGKEAYEIKFSLPRIQAFFEIYRSKGKTTEAPRKSVVGLASINASDHQKTEVYDQLKQEGSFIENRELKDDLFFSALFDYVRFLNSTSLLRQLLSKLENIDIFQQIAESAEKTEKENSQTAQELRAVIEKENLNHYELTSPIIAYNRWLMGRERNVFLHPQIRHYDYICAMIEALREIGHPIVRRFSKKEGPEIKYTFSAHADQLKELLKRMQRESKNELWAKWFYLLFAYYLMGNMEDEYRDLIETNPLFLPAKYRNFQALQETIEMIQKEKSPSKSLAVLERSTYQHYLQKVHIYLQQKLCTKVLEQPRLQYKNGLLDSGKLLLSLTSKQAQFCEEVFKHAVREPIFVSDLEDKIYEIAGSNDRVRSLVRNINRKAREKLGIERLIEYKNEKVYRLY